MVLRPVEIMTSKRVKLFESHVWGVVHVPSLLRRSSKCLYTKEELLRGLLPLALP